MFTLKVLVLKKNASELLLNILSTFIFISVLEIEGIKEMHKKMFDVHTILYLNVYSLYKSTPFKV